VNPNKFLKTAQALKKRTASGIKQTQIMKKLFLIILSLFIYSTSFSQNISTGVDALGNPLTPGTNDNLWKLVSPSPFVGNSIVEISPLAGTWNPSPMTGTNAQFIGNKSNPGSQLKGIQYFERAFSVPAGTKTMSYSFSLTADDEIQTVEFINPSGGVEKDLTSSVSIPKGYYLSKVIGGKIETCDKSGKWTIRVKVNFIDNIAGFMLSGIVNLDGSCGYEDTKCCTGEKAQNLSTGYGNVPNSLIPNAVNDDDWTISSPTPTPAYVSNPAISSYAPASSKAQWITPKGGGDGSSYTFERTIVVPAGFKANLTFSRIGGDNEVDLFTDSPSIGKVLRYHSSFPTAVGGVSFWAKNAILKSCLVVKDLGPGTHKIICEVKNDGGETGLLVEGCFELVQTACNCPQGWLSNTSNIDGDITLDGQCKKMICGPLNIKPFPKNGTQVDGNIGFFWDGNLYWYGTKANGGAAICPKNMASATEIKGALKAD
jgi:hypothetical protein